MHRRAVHSAAVWHQNQAVTQVDHASFSTQESSFAFQMYFLFPLLFTDRAGPLSIDHFSQNGNIKNVAHIDADVNVDNDNDDDDVPQKVGIQEKPDVELALKDIQLTEKKDAPEKNESDESKPKDSLFRYPKEKNIFRQFLWIIVWPTELLFFLTIPNCEHNRFKNLFPLTFLMCIVWIGSLSYLVAWMITIVG